KKIFNLEPESQLDGSQFDHLFDNDEVFQVGQLQGQALFVPGHTPADMAYRFGDAIFVGDTMFMPDVGTARADFPGGDAHTLLSFDPKAVDLSGHNPALYVPRLSAAHSRTALGHDGTCSARQQYSCPRWHYRRCI